MSIARTSICLVSTLALAMLAACGGGSGAGGGGATGERLGLSRDAVNLTESVTSNAHLEVRVVARVMNAASPGYFIRVTHGTNGLFNVVRASDSGNEIEVILEFRTPLDLQPGVHTDEVRFVTCADASCTRLLPNLTASLTTQFTITGSNGISAELSTNAVTLQAFITDPVVPGVTDLDFTIDGVTVQPLVEVASTQNAVTSVTGGMSDVHHGSIRYNLRRPGELGPGVFDDTITITVCLDVHCVNPVPQSPLTFSLQLTVADTVGGSNGYTVRITDVTGTAMAWDPLRQLIYLARPDPANAEIAHSIVVFDPAGMSSYAVPITWHPGPMAISDDSSLLYVGTAYSDDQLKRLRLPDLAEDISIDLGMNAEGQPYAARELAVAPSQPNIVAMARTIHPAGVNTAGVVVFDDATPRSEIVGAVPDLANGPVIDHITWGADDTRIFASNNSGQNTEVYDISVDASGGQIARTTDAATPGRLHFAADLLYADNGLIFDPATLAQVATLVPQRDGTNGVLSRVLVDPGTNRIYAIARFLQLPFDGFGWPISLVSFDLTQRAQIASVPLDTSYSFHLGHMVRWGPDGLALLSPGDELIFINGAFVAP